MHLSFLFLLLQRQQRLNQNCTFQSLLLNLAANLIRLADVAMEQISIGMAAARTEEPRPAAAAFLFVEHMALTEILWQFLIGHALIE